MQLTLADLYTQHRSELVAHACSCGCDCHSAEDHVQSVFLTLHRQGSVAKLDSQQNVVGWLKQALQWAISKAYTRSTRQCRGSGAMHVEIDDAACQVADTAETPDAALSRKQTRQILAACGVTEASVIWSPSLSRAEAVALYRFRRAVAPKVRKLLSC